MAFRPHHALAALPAIAVAVGVPFANRVHAYVLGLPFLLFWMLACVLLTSLVMAVVGALDRRDAARSRPGREPRA
jgi:formate hydrogenlyase subunit 3/multisubunit Na+/H+ antiporter MnhD subunit